MSDGQIRLYDREIIKFKNYISTAAVSEEGIREDVLSEEGIREEAFSEEGIRLSEKGSWPVTDRETLVLRSDMAYELGGGTGAAVSGLAFSTDPGLVRSSGVFLIGEDLPKLQGDVSYGRITLLRLNKSVDITKTDELYRMLRKIEYTRYHVYPKGYMMRISAVHEREPVRISREALSKGMDFASVGQSFIEAYKKNPGVEDVQVYFITDPNADYRMLSEFAKKCSDITQSLDQVFQGFSMDCSTCGQRELCDEIDGLKELHRELLGTNA